ncbi:hypothetical protein [Anaerobranca gottschalkii]|uniref:Uncharacterized protein n=1 Tax=Anaerobranca gottschalkii DSM 13577 TaxID=1120990 RepID=A0A1H9ZBS9_9FIRM|nr:hypothetical protein [Anaerobranca gottschalkii]SES79033.1 hypothetical protein SAMN03080614_100812 [Anaerobranca gottschalkii DSM 13577]
MFKKFSLSSFFIGFFVGFFLLIIAFSSITYFTFYKGLILTIDTRSITPVIAEQVSEIVEIQLPHYVDALKTEIPYIVDSELTGQIKSASIKIGDMEYPLPPDTVKGIEETFKSQVKIAMVRLLEGLDEKVIAQSISRDISIKIDELIDNNLNSKTILFDPIKILTIPIIIDIQDQGEELTSIFTLTLNK